MPTSSGLAFVQTTQPSWSCLSQVRLPAGCSSLMAFRFPITIHGLTRTELLAEGFSIPKSLFFRTCSVAQEFIDAERFHDIDVVVLWSAEGKLIKDAITKGCNPRNIKFTEITHHF